MNWAAIYSLSAQVLRKLRRSKKFNRSKAARRLTDGIRQAWAERLDALWKYLDDADAWASIHRATRLNRGKTALSKTLSDDERKLVDELLAGFSFSTDEDGALTADSAKATFNSAARSALAQLGVSAAEFELRNEDILAALDDRKSAAALAGRNNIEAVMQSIVVHFGELGENPYDASFLKDLKSELGQTTDWQAKRFALTETAIAAEMAQQETWSRNGVERKQWNALGNRTRPSHQRMHGEQAPIDGKYRLVSDDGNIYEPSHPCDASLPPGELVNCHCWSTPVVSDDWQIDSKTVWEGQ